MWRQALDGERPAHPDTLVVLIGLVVERLEVGVSCNRVVYLLPAHALPDVGIVGDRPERDVRYPPVDEALADIAVGPVVGRRLAGEVGFLPDPFRRVGQQVEGVSGRH